MNPLLTDIDYPAFIAITEQSPLGSSLNGEALIAQTEACKDWESRYRILMQLGKQLPTFAKQYQQPNFEIHGCESQVWLVMIEYHGRYYFLAHSPARIVKGLLAALLAELQGADREKIAAFSGQEYFQRLGLGKHLTPSRSNGLLAIIKAIKEVVC